MTTLLTRRGAVLLGVIAAAALAGTTRAVWIRAVAPDLTGTVQTVETVGTQAAPALLALALVALAAALATSLSGRWVRFVTGPVLIAAGIGSGFAIGAVLTDPESAARSAVAQRTGVAGGDLVAHLEVWPWLALVPCVLVIAVGVLVLVRGGAWVVSSRWSRGTEPVTDPQDDPAAVWDALSRGEDPTDHDEESDEAPDPAPDAAPDEERDEPQTEPRTENPDEGHHRVGRRS